MTEQELDNLSINTIRMLSADAVERANSGHPGLPMGAAAFAYTLWTKHLRFNPADPAWLNRDRFVLSAGHGSMLLYSLLHLTGYSLPLDELKQFRQWDSKTPGHPEHHLTPGVEYGRAPFGQGFANGVGMGLAQKILADRYNTEDFTVIDYMIYVLISDGDLMEGISAEAASYAGSLKLSNLVYLYDSNRISIEGSTDLTFCDDTEKRFAAYGWHTQIVADGNNLAEIDEAIQVAKKDARPSLIIFKTHIGYGSPHKQDTAAAHGSALGEDELRLTKQALGWPVSPDFYIPDEVKAHMLLLKDKGAQQETAWEEKFSQYTTKYPELALELKNAAGGVLPNNWPEHLPTFTADEKPMATREASGKVMNAIAPSLPLFVGGSADLAPSNNSHLNDYGNIAPNVWDHDAKNLHFGIREHAMGGILNGLALFPGIIPFGATFLCFSDYMRASIRLASLMKLGVIYIFTHDSIGQGEDGATHQPIEHLASLRAMPGLCVIRPADATETVEAWRYAITQRNQPTALIFTRQKLPVLNRQELSSAENVKYGGYILKDSSAKPDMILIATGSEVAITLEAAKILDQDKVHCRVVSLPSTEIFEKQTAQYRDTVLPPEMHRRIVIEAASPFGWEKYAGPAGKIIGIDSFGASAPGAVMLQKFGFTPENIVNNAKQMLSDKE